MLVKKLDGDQQPSVNRGLEENNVIAKSNGSQQSSKLPAPWVSIQLLQLGVIQGPFCSSLSLANANCSGVFTTLVQAYIQKSLEQSGWIELLCLPLFSPASDAQ